MSRQTQPAAQVNFVMTKTTIVTPQTFFLNDCFSWNLIFRCFKVHHEFIIIFRNYFSIKWNFWKIYPVRSNSEQLTEIEFLKIPNE